MYYFVLSQITLFYTHLQGLDGFLNVHEFCISASNGMFSSNFPPLQVLMRVSTGRIRQTLWSEITAAVCTFHRASSRARAR
jgi:hypothetical protein